MQLKSLILGTLLCGTLLAPGAAAQRKELQQLLRDVVLLQEALRQQEQANSERMAALEALLRQSTEKQDKLNTGQAVLDRKISELDRELAEPIRANSAMANSLASQFSELRGTVEEMNLAVERIALDVKDIKTHLSELPPPMMGEDGEGGAESDINTSEAIFEGGMDDYMRGNIESARGQFMDYLALYPSHSKAGEAQYYLAETYYSAADYEEAARQFEQVFRRYPLSSLAPDALYKQGMAFLRLRNQDAAKEAFEGVIKRFPGKNVAQHARGELNTLLSAKPSPAN
ncbi:MAG: tol-pal system protein YbgF [Bryobacterales bacterium]|nr:tol-pal system protein YbgF [Bryobacterales bacterium]